MEQLSCSLAGWDCGGLGKGDWHRLGCSGEGLWHHLNLSLALGREHCHLDPDLPTEVSSLSHLANSTPRPS